MFKKLSSNLKIYKAELKNKGLVYVITARIYKLIIDPLTFTYSYYLKRPATFVFNNTKYNYFYHKYNYTWKNERCIEIPIIWKLVNKYPASKVLELGNVLSHYYPVSHDILDKYEKSKNVINEDVVSFKPKKKYELIVAISTLEHVGWDEKIKSPDKILHAVKNLKSLLLPGGRLVVTLPLGYNTYLEEMLNNQKLVFNKYYFMKRISRSNKWIQVTRDEVTNIRYNYPYDNANAIIYGIVTK